MAYGDDTATVDPSRQDVPSLDLPGAVQGMMPPQQIARIPDPQTMLPERQVRQPPQQRLPTVEPPPFRTPYQAASPRGYSQWGQDWWPLQSGQFYPGTEMPPGLPSGREALGVIQGAGQQLWRWGPPGVSQPAGRAAGLAGMLMNNPFLTGILNSASGGAFSKNMMAAQEGKLRMMEEQMALNAEQAVQESKRLLLEYGKIYDTWRLGGITDDDAERQTEALAIASGHTDLLATLKTAGMNGVEAYLEQQDTRTMDLAAGAASTRKGSKSGAKSAYGDDEEEGGGGIPKREEVRLQKQDVGGAIETGKPVNAMVEAVKTGDVDEYLHKKYGLGSGGRSAARNAMTDSTAINKGDPLHNRASSASAEMRDAVRTIASEDPKIDPGLPTNEQKDLRQADIDRKLKLIAKINPDLAADTRAVLDYDAPITGLKAHVQDPVRALAHELSPRTSAGGGFVEANYAAIQEFKRLGSNPNKVATRSAELMQGARNSVDATYQMLERSGGRDVRPIPQQVLDKWLSGAWSGDPEYDKMYSAFQGMMNQFAAIISLSGTPRVTTVQQLLKEAGPGKSPRQLLVQFAQDIANAWNVAENYQSQWESLTGRHTFMPGFHKAEWDAYMTLARMNWETGEMPKDAPPEWRAISRDPAKASSRIPKERRWTPLRMDQLRDLRHWIAKLSLGDEDQRRQADEMSKRLPPFLNVRVDTPDPD